MGFQSSFNQALGIVAGAAFSRKHVKGQKESIAEQKIQGKFNLEREINRDQEQQEVKDYNLQRGTAYSDKNEMMADRAGQALASETTSKKETSQAVRLPNHKEWLQKYMEFYGVGVREAMNAYDKNAMRMTERAYAENNKGKIIEKVLSADADELLNKEKKYKGGNK